MRHFGGAGVHFLIYKLLGRIQTLPIAIGLLSEFWRRLTRAKWGDDGPSLEDLCLHLESYMSGRRQGAMGPWERLFLTLREQDGWGPKTAALFVKSTINIHRGDARLHFLKDPEVAISNLESDRIHLPVDAVILHIFASGGKRNFDSINNLLKSYSPEEMLIWDDLWFWGFFNQQIEGKKRKWAWNPDKYWT